MRDFLLIGTGAVLGANLRYWIGGLFADRLGLAFPYATLFINVTGSFLLGFMLTLLANRLVADPAYRLLLGTGFLGAYTTFSTFSYDTLALLQRGDLIAALINAGASLFGSLLAAYAGVLLAQFIS
ncbi:MAG: fluoride efflux transporter CrcB [Chloroflexota bacterium]|nr:fluoride efflux transporter CrcB [Chloroflexota bacterium]